MDYRRARRDIQKGFLRPLYLFCGPEEYLKEELLREIVCRMEQKGGSVDLERISGSELTVAELLESTRQATIFSGGRVLFIVEPPYLSSSGTKKPSPGVSDRKEGRAGRHWGDGQAAERELLSLMNDKISDTVIVFSVKAADKRKKMVKAMAKSGVLVDFPPLKGDSLVKWVKEELELENKEIEEKALYVLLDKTGEDLFMLKKELEKMVCFLGEERTVTETAVRLLVPESSPGSVFDLVSAVGRRDVSRAFFLLHKMRLKNEPPLVILALLARQFRFLYRARSMQQQGVSFREIVSSLKLPPFVVRELLEQVGSYDEQILVRVFLYLKETDADIKSGRRGADEALEQLILRLTGGSMSEGK